MNIMLRMMHLNFVDIYCFMAYYYYLLKTVKI